MPANDDVKCGAVGAVFSVRSEAVSRSVIFGGGFGLVGCLGRLVSPRGDRFRPFAREERCGCEWSRCVNVSCGGEECQSSIRFHKAGPRALGRSEPIIHAQSLLLVVDCRLASS